MDTTKPIQYRGFDMNTTSQDGGGGAGTGITGAVVDSADLSDYDVVQFQEKRSLEDGVDVGQVFIGQRRVRIAGTLYGKTRALLYDQKAAFEAAMAPTLAQMDSPLDHGYMPLYFSDPTNDTDNWPSGAIDKQVFAMPKQHDMIEQRNQQGGNELDALAIPYQLTMLMADPRIYSATTVDHAFTNTPIVTGATATASTNLVNKTGHGMVAGQSIYFMLLTGGTGLALATEYYVIASGLTADAFKVSAESGGTEVDITGNYSAVSYYLGAVDAGNWKNRGTYTTPLNMLIEVDAWGGTIVVSAGDSQFTITIPSSTGNRTIRYKGSQKIVTIEEGGQETLAQGAITWQNSTTWALLPSGDSPFSVTFNGVRLQTGSHMWFWEAWL